MRYVTTSEQMLGEVTAYASASAAVKLHLIRTWGANAFMKV